MAAFPFARNPKELAMAIFSFEGHMPQVAPDAYVADNATVLGRVRLGARASVWFAATVRGDNDDIGSLAFAALGIITDNSGFDIERHTSLHTEANQRKLFLCIGWKRIELQHRDTSAIIGQNQYRPATLAAA